MQYCSLQHQTLLPYPVTSTIGGCFSFGSVSSFFLELFLRWSPVAYWAPTDLGSSSFSVLSFCLFILFMRFSRQVHWVVCHSLLWSVLCKFCWFHCGINSNLLQEGLCYTQVCCTQSPCTRPLLTCALPRSENLRRPGAWWAHCPRWAMRLNHFLGPHCSVSQVCCGSTVSGVPYVSSGTLEESLRTKLVEVMEFLLSYFRS